MSGGWDKDGDGDGRWGGRGGGVGGGCSLLTQLAPFCCIFGPQCLRPVWCLYTWVCGGWRDAGGLFHRVPHRLLLQ